MLDLLVRLTEGGPGTRIPPERQLAAQFGVSRSEIRKALARLELDGRLSREVGRGTFVRAPAEAGASHLDVLRDSTSPRNAMEARLVLEPELASLAAVNATFKQIEGMRALAQQMREAGTWKDYEMLDGRLHRLIAEATGNPLLAEIHRTVDDVRRAVVWRWLDTRPIRPPDDYSSFAEHDALVDAIEQHDRLKAGEAMRRHLQTTMDKLMGTRA
ncbi:FadR family transcriptional regulator [Bradyrhizobium diazoefficiens]|nr:FCD domain-containing protein [Bradyrhizobium diazoefficiens]MBR0848986.1 FadR family transcriptional regulator [Bradyrhizobium diazoefficiens]